MVVLSGRTKEGNVDKQAAVPKAALKKWELNLNADNNYELAAA